MYIVIYSISFSLFWVVQDTLKTAYADSTIPAQYVDDDDDDDDDEDYDDDDYYYVHQ